MIRDTFFGNKRTDFMVGIEVEHTAAYGKKTLFVQGFKSYSEIYNKAVELQVDHIYLGANRSFEIGHNWAALISRLLNDNFIVTIDYAIKFDSYVPRFDSINYIQMATIDIPNVAKNKNFRIKIDDPSALNEGVWCLYIDDDTFTSWDTYSDDKTI